MTQDEAYQILNNAAESIGFVCDKFKDQLEDIARAIVEDPRNQDEDERGTYVVDLPTEHGAWEELASFTTREQALKFVQKTFGSDNGWINLITFVAEDEDDNEDDDVDENDDENDDQ